MFLGAGGGAIALECPLLSTVRLALVASLILSAAHPTYLAGSWQLAMRRF